jgi:hypothetical protein
MQRPLQLFATPMLLVAKTAAANCDHQMAKQQRCTQRRAAKMGLPTQVRHTKRSAHLLGNARLLCTLARHLGQIDLRAPMASSMLFLTRAASMRDLRVSRGCLGKGQHGEQFSRALQK